MQIKSHEVLQHTLEGIKSMSTRPSVSKDVETTDVLTYFWLECQMYSCFGKVLTVSFKVQHSLPYDPEIQRVLIYPREIRACP